MPFYLPSVVLNPLSIRAFNALYYHKQVKKICDSVVPYEGFFYPLDAVLHWNRLYGRSGFVQYQFVVPKAAGCQGLVEILRRISQRGWGSFLAVLKLFGPQDSLISFPMARLHAGARFPHTARAFRLFGTTLIASCLPTAVACTSRKMRACSVRCSGQLSPQPEIFRYCAKI